MAGGALIMFKVLSTIPASKRKDVESGAGTVAAVAPFFGILLLLTGVLPDEDGEIGIAGRAAFLVIGVGLIAAGLIALFVKLRLATLPDDGRGKLSKYLAVLTGHETIALSEIADIVDASPSRVRFDIQSLIDSGSITDFYIDHKHQRVVSKKYTPKASQKTVTMCSGCGWNNDVVDGITKYCAQCGVLLPLPPRGVAPARTASGPAMAPQPDPSHLPNNLG